MTKILAGHTAPAFSLPGLDGKPLGLSEALRSGPVILAFYKISCPVCQFTFPFLERLHRGFGGNGVTFLGISQDDVADSRDFCNEYGITFPNLVDGDSYPVSNQYGLTHVPTVLLIAPDGKVQVSSMGFSKKDLEEIAESLSRHAGKSVTAFTPADVVPDCKPG